MIRKNEQVHRDDIVISLREPARLFNKTFTIGQPYSAVRRRSLRLTVGEFCGWLYNFIANKLNINSNELQKWTKEGLKCRILFPYQSWKMGKVSRTPP